MQNQKSKIKNIRGFSFIELIVAVAIMAIITSAVLFRQSKFSSDILITNMTYEIALAIRQAQVYGISSKQSPSVVTVPGGSSVDKYKVGYGVHFEPSPVNYGGKPSSWIDFIDIPTSVYGVGDNTLFGYTYDVGEKTPDSPSTLAQGKIKQYCAGDGTNWTCGPDVDMGLDIVFVKPNPDAHITSIDSTGTPVTHSQAKIIVESALGDKCRTVTVYSSGQISVDPVNSSSTIGGCESL